MSTQDQNRTEKLSVDDFVECTTQARTKRHLSLKPAHQWGMSTLCGHRAYDQAWVYDAMPAGWRERTVIAEMPSCKQCEKSRNRLMEGRKS